MSEYIIGGSVIAVVWLVWFIAGLSGSAARQRDSEQDLEDWEGVIDVRRKAEEAKHNDLDTIKRVRDKYNS